MVWYCRACGRGGGLERGKESRIAEGRQAQQSAFLGLATLPSTLESHRAFTSGVILWGKAITPHRSRGGAQKDSNFCNHRKIVMVRGRSRDMGCGDKAFQIGE